MWYSVDLHARSHQHLYLLIFNFAGIALLLGSMGYVFFGLLGALLAPAAFLLVMFIYGKAYARGLDAGDASNAS